MKWNWILLILVLVSCNKKQSDQENHATTEVEEVQSADLLPIEEDTLIIIEEPKEEAILVALEEKIEEEPERNTDLKPQVLSEIEVIPEAPEGEYIVEPPIDTSGYASLEAYYARAFEGKEEYFTDGLDFPVGKPDGRGYYIAQKYLQNRHLGDDFNAHSGGNTDLGDPVYAVANGVVSFAYDLEGGWGNTVRIVHRHEVGEMIESLYSHLDEIHVSFGQYVKRGDQIGTIGTAHGQYMAHLHFEIRTKVNMPLGRGYSDELEPDGYTAPTPFIRNNRPW